MNVQITNKNTIKYLKQLKKNGGKSTQIVEHALRLHQRMNDLEIQYFELQLWYDVRETMTKAFEKHIFREE